VIKPLKTNIGVQSDWQFIFNVMSYYYCNCYAQNERLCAATALQIQKPAETRKEATIDDYITQKTTPSRKSRWEGCSSTVIVKELAYTVLSSNLQPSDNTLLGRWKKLFYNSYVKKLMQSHKLQNYFAKKEFAILFMFNVFS
jgi:hypothetical protein